MHGEEILRELRVRMENMSIFDLRQSAREIGVRRVPDKKQDIIEFLINVAKGVTEPQTPSKRGAPVKSRGFDEQLVADIRECRGYFLNAVSGNGENVEINMSVGDSSYEKSKNSEFTAEGFLERIKDEYFLRTENGEVFVHGSFVSRHCLREGDYVTGKARRLNPDEGAGLVTVNSVNGKNAETAPERREFSRLTHVYPEVNLKTAHGCDDISCRIIDMFAPLAFGQRAFISAPPKSGKTALLKRIAAGICAGYRQAEVIILLIDESPEVVTDFKRSGFNVKLLYTTFAETADNHLRTAKLAFECAKRQTEEGKDAVILFDGISRLAEIFKTVYGLDQKVSEEIKKLLYCACNAEEGGSLTLISTIDKADGFGFIGLANEVITLSRELAVRRIYPAIDVTASFSDCEDKLLSADALKAVTNLRARMLDGMTAEELIKIFKDTDIDSEIINKYV